MVREHGGGDEIVVPPTIHALLQARIDSLDADVRVVMERGSVEGEVFHRGAVSVLSPDPASTRGRVASRDARPQGAHPLHITDVSRRRGLPLPAPTHPRRRLRGAAEGHPCRAPRALRRVAVGPPPRRKRRDRRLSPRAGAPVPGRARRLRSGAPGTRATRVRVSRDGRPRSAPTRRLQRRPLTVRSRDDPAPGERRGETRARAGLRGCARRVELRRSVERRGAGEGRRRPRDAGSRRSVDGDHEALYESRDLTRGQRRVAERGPGRLRGVRERVRPRALLVERRPGSMEPVARAGGDRCRGACTRASRARR